MWAQLMMYKAVVKPVFLYGSESWVVTDAMLKVLWGVPPSSSLEYFRVISSASWGREI